MTRGYVNVSYARRRSMEGASSRAAGNAGHVLENDAGAPM
jgi:hypothetical protein